MNTRESRKKKALPKPEEEEGAVGGSTHERFQDPVLPEDPWEAPHQEEARELPSAPVTSGTKEDDDDPELAGISFKQLLAYNYKTMSMMARMMSHNTKPRVMPPPKYSLRAG